MGIFSDFLSSIDINYNGTKDGKLSIGINLLDLIDARETSRKIRDKTDNDILPLIEDKKNRHKK